MDINRHNIVEVKTNKVIHNNIVTSFISKIKFENGVEAIIEASINYNKERTAIIKGTLGVIEVPMCNRPNNFVIKINDKEPINIEKEYKVDDFFSQIEEVNKCIEEGLKESKRMPLDESLRVIKVLDKI